MSHDIWVWKLTFKDEGYLVGEPRTIRGRSDWESSIFNISHYLDRAPHIDPDHDWLPLGLMPKLAKHAMSRKWGRVHGNGVTVTLRKPLPLEQRTRELIGILKELAMPTTD